jgi:very-short-patch-repair endonuclease
VKYLLQFSITNRILKSSKTISGTVPVQSVENLLGDRWPPKWIAFYQTKVFLKEQFAVNYYAEVIDIRKAYRFELFPGNPLDEKKEKLYFKLTTGPLVRLPRPIFSRRMRRVVFIPTTWEKFIMAQEINELYYESQLEERLWEELIKFNIPAERQEFVTVEGTNYFLDFAVYCANGKIAIEADGDKWHANPEKSAKDNLRDNALKTVGWNIFHFTSSQIIEQTSTYCLPQIKKAVNNLGGIHEGNDLPKKIIYSQDDSWQLSLFD